MLILIDEWFDRLIIIKYKQTNKNYNYNKYSNGAMALTSINGCTINPFQYFDSNHFSN